MWTDNADQTAQPAWKPVWVWGVPFAPLSFAETLAQVAELIAARRPGYFITANLNYVMLSAHEPRLVEVNRKAAFILADGMPMVWYSRRGSERLPERVAGSDLIFALAEQAARLGHRLFLLGGAPGVGETAARNLGERYPGLQVVGIEAPAMRSLTPEEHNALLERIRAARPDLLLVALGQPKGEIWLHDHLDTLGVPACVQVGASLDFAAGRVARAPRWIARIGMEWFFRFALEPMRLGPRYWRNGWFLLWALATGGPKPPAPQ